jgi:hypothetical protein
MIGSEYRKLQMYPTIRPLRIDGMKIIARRTFRDLICWLRTSAMMSARRF